MNIETNSISFVITTVTTVVLAFVGYMITYLNNLRLSQHRDRIERVNKQLGEFYGPLFALVNASRIARLKFMEKYADGRTSFFKTEKKIKHSEKDLKTWRHWMKTVFMPINIRIYELILSKSDLLIESDMPTCLVELCAHVTSYRVVLEQWEQGDYTEHIALISFPKELNNYAKKSFELLKSEQARLLGKKYVQK